MVSNHRSWDYDVVNDIFGMQNRDLILQIPLNTQQDNDLWYWLANPLGSYTVRSCYKLLDHISVDLNDGVWRRIWNLKMSGKVKKFFWRSTMNVLPTTNNLIRRRVEVLPTCSICNASIETVSSVLVDCNFSRSYWISSTVGYVGHCSLFLLWLENLFGYCKKKDCKPVVMIC